MIIVKGVVNLYDNKQSIMNTHVGLQKAGTRFTWLGRHFIVSDNQIRTCGGKSTTCITGSFVKVQELHGMGTTHTWFGEPENFQADVVLESSNIGDWLTTREDS